MPLRRPRRFTAFIVTLTLFALAILALVLWRSLGPDEPDNSLAALAVPARELAAARAALEDAGLSGSIISSYDTQLVVSDFSRLIYLSAADAFRRISSSDPRRTPLIDALERAFYIRIGDDTWTTLYTARRGDSLEQASLALRAQAIPVLSSIGAPSSPGLSVSRLSWLLSLALGLYFVAAKPRHDLRYRLLLVLSGAPLMLSASVESLLTALAFISCAKTVYDRYPLRATDEGRLVMAIGRRMPFLALIAPYVFFVLCMIVLNPAIIAYSGVALALYAAAFAWGPKLAALDRAILAHSPPAFVRIGASILSKGYLSTLRVFMLLTALGLALALFSGAPDTGERAEAVLAMAYERVTESEGSPLKLHYAYQSSLTWGRLGEARWGNTAYTSSVPPALSGSVEGEGEAPTGQFTANALHSVLDSGYIPVVHLSKSSTRLQSSQPLDFTRLLFCLLALIPGLGLIIYGRLRLS